MHSIEGKKALVTGGAGSIGSNLVKELLKLKCSVVVIDNLSSGFKENLPLGKIEFIQEDILNENALKEIFSKNIDIVFHLAAQFANQNSVEHPVEDTMTNSIGTLKLLQLSQKNNVEKFIFSSSSCVYGSKGGSLKEDDASFELDTPYAINKLAGEQYVNFYHRFHGLNTTIMRYFNSYGPGERPGKYRNVIANFIFDALNSKPLVITGTGEETRDFTYVEDLARGTILAAQSDKTNGETINVGTGREVKIKELVEKINKLTGNKAAIKFLERRKWDSISKRLSSIRKAGQLMGYAPKYALDEGLKNTIEWFREKVISMISVVIPVYNE